MPTTQTAAHEGEAPIDSDVIALAAKAYGHSMYSDGYHGEKIAAALRAILVGPLAWRFRFHWKDESDLRDEWHITTHKNLIEEMQQSGTLSEDTVLEVQPLYFLRATGASK